MGHRRRRREDAMGGQRGKSEKRRKNPKIRGREFTFSTLTFEKKETIISPSISERANVLSILKMRRSRQVPWPDGHSEPGTVEARYNGAAGITLRSSDLNGGSPVGKTRRAALKHRGLLELRKGAGFIRQIRWHHGCSSDSS